MASLRFGQSNTGPDRFKEFLERQKTRIDSQINVPHNKQEFKEKIVHNELDFAVLVLQACSRWANVEKAIVFWDIDNTLGFEISDHLFYPRPGIFDLLKFICAEFPNLVHGILSYRPKHGENSIESLFSEAGCLRELDKVLNYRLSARRFAVYSGATIASKNVSIVGFKAPEDIVEELMELRARGLSQDAILEKLGVIECLKRKGRFSKIPIHLIDDLKNIEMAMGAACLSVAKFSPYDLSMLVQQEGIQCIYSNLHQLKSHCGILI